jgi:hypothetical protein
MHQPDCDVAQKWGEIVGEQRFMELVEDYKLYSGSTAKDHERWVEIRERFIKAVGELFVEDACNSF